MTYETTRRSFMLGSLATGLFTGLPSVAWSADPIRLGSLVPMTGAGSAFGPDIHAGHELAVTEVQAAGGLLGRPVELVFEDDQTNPEAGVRAAQQLIQVNKVTGIMGVWGSAVASAVAPLCWNNKVMLICIGSADSITALPHEGFVARTQPSFSAYSLQIGKFTSAHAKKHLYIMMPQTPFTETTLSLLTKYGADNGIKVSSLVYDGTKPSYRREVQEMVAADPDILFMGGYVTDNIVLMKDVYRTGFKGTKIALATGATPKLVEAVGNDVAEGIYCIEPVADSTASAYSRLQGLAPDRTLNTYICQGYDQANLAMLAMALGKDASGQAIRDNIRKVGDPNGVSVDNAVDGIRLLAEGKPINYEGASSSCKFADNGDILEPHFRINLVKDGKFETYQEL